MASEEKKGPLTFVWSDPKELLIVGIFVIFALVCEFFIVSFFAYSGLAEASELPISPLFHLLPLTVILVLVSSWIYLTKQVVTRPHKVSVIKVSKKRRRRPRRLRTRSRPSFVERIRRVFMKINSTLYSADDESFVKRTRSFWNIALETAVTVLAIFLIAVILLAVLVYPNLFTEFATGLYNANTALYGFVLSIAEALNGILEALGPINDFFSGIAPGFRSAFETVVSPRTQHLASSDILWRYVFCQNAAAWISAVSALAYSRYFLRAKRRI